MTTLCLYTYYEDDQTPQTRQMCRTNFQYFLKHGLDANADIDYIIVVSDMEKCTVPLNPKSNVRIISRCNGGYDFGAYTDALKVTDVSKYDYFIFINTSVRGPYLASNSNAWHMPFIDMIKGNVKLVGTTINVHTHHTPKLQDFDLPHSHVQSMVFALDKECLDYLMDPIFTATTATTKVDVILHKELLMSQLVLKKGWNIDCLLPKYRGQDYRTITADINPTSFFGDASYRGAYFGGTYEAKDVMFIKTDPARQLPIPFDKSLIRPNIL